MTKLPIFQFRLFVAGRSQNSTQAIGNLRAFCRDLLPDGHTIEIIDIFVDPKRALADGVLLTPTLVVLSPDPVRRIVGTLSQRGPLLAALGLYSEPA